MSYEFEPILSLSCFDYITVAIKAAESLDDVVAEIVKTGELVGYERSEILGMVEAYSEALGVEQMARNNRSMQEELPDGDTKDDIGVLDELVSMQVRRLKVQEVQEIVQGFPYKTFGVEMDVAAKVVLTRAKVRGLVYGIRKGGFDEVAGSASQTENTKFEAIEKLYGKRAAEVLRSPSARRKMLSTIESIHALGPVLRPMLTQPGEGEGEVDA